MVAAVWVPAGPTLAQSGVAVTERATAAIPAGPLGGAVTAYAERMGITVLFEPGMVAGVASPGLDVVPADAAAGLAVLLRGTGLEAVSQRPGTFILRRSVAATGGVATLSPVTVSGVVDARERVYETPASVAVVTREQIERLPPRNAADLLHEVTGVYTSSGRGDPGLSVNIRGMQDFGRVNVMIDGARQNYQQSGHGSNGQVYFDPALISQVDVVKGPVSTVGGAGVIAGMVNFRTLEIDDVLAPDRTVGGRVQMTSGSNAYHFAGNAAVGARLGEDVDVVAAVSRKNVGAFEIGRHGREDARADGGMISQTTRQDQWAGLFKARWRPSAEHEWKLGYVGMDARFAEIPGDGTAYGERTDEYRVRTQTYKLDYAWRPSGSRVWALDAGLYYTNTHRGTERAFEDDASRGYRLRYQTETVGGSVANESLLTLGPVRGSWRNGGEFWHDWTSPRFNDAGSSLSEGLWYTGPTPEGKRTVASAFSELNLGYDDWLELIAGLRYDWYKLSGSGQVYVETIRNPPAVRPPTTVIYTGFEVDRHAGAFAPKLTLAAKPASWAQFYVSYGEGLRPPSLTETLMHGMHAGNMFPFYASPNLREERSRNWEFGLNLNTSDILAQGDFLRAKVAWFHTRVDDYMIGASVMRPASVASCYGLFCPQAYVNLLDPVTFKGLELQIEYDAGVAFGGLTYTRVHADWGAMRYDPFPMGSWVGYPDTDMGSGTDASNLGFLAGGPPRLKLGLTGGVRLLDQRLELGMRMRYEKPSTLGFMAQYPATRAWDAWVGYRASDTLMLRLAAENLFDEKFVEVSGGAGGWSWAPGRTVMGTLSYSF